MLLSGSAGIYIDQSGFQAQETSVTSSLLWLDFSRDCQMPDLNAENILGTIWITLFTAT